MADGSQRTVKVNQGVLEAYMVPTGSSVPVVYNPSNPDDVRPAMTFARVQHYLELVGLGLLLLFIAFIGPILRGYWERSQVRKPRALIKLRQN